MFSFHYYSALRKHKSHLRMSTYLSCRDNMDERKKNENKRLYGSYPFSNAKLKLMDSRRGRQLYIAGE